MLLLAGSAATAVGGAANAAVLFSFLEDPTGVTGILSGSLDLLAGGGPARLAAPVLCRTGACGSGLIRYR